MTSPAEGLTSAPPARVPSPWPLGRCDVGAEAHPDPTGVDRVVRRPTWLATLPIVATVVLAALSVLTQNSWLLAPAGAGAGLFLAGLVLAPQVNGLVVCLIGPSRLAVGARGSYELHIHNRGTRTSSLTRVTQRIRGFADVTVLAPALAPGASAVLHLHRSALTRGTAGRCEVVLTSSEPLGLQRVRRTVSRAGTLVVHPPTVAPAQVPGGEQDPNRDAVSSRAGLDPYGIRGWRPGDPTATVHWRSTARRGHLVVVERSSAGPGAVTVLLAAIADDHGWEKVIALAAATACAQVRAGRSVTLAAHSGAGPAICTGSPTELLDWCAGLGRPRLPDAATLHLATSRAGPGGTVSVAATAAVPALWWAWADELEGARGVRLVPLLAAYPTAPLR